MIAGRCFYYRCLPNQIVAPNYYDHVTIPTFQFNLDKEVGTRDVAVGVVDIITVRSITKRKVATPKSL